MYLLKRTRNLFGVLLILILICLLLASCTEAPDGGDNDTPQNGTEGDTPPGGETPDDSTQPPEEETSWKDKLFEANNHKDQTQGTSRGLNPVGTDALDEGLKGRGLAGELPMPYYPTGNKGGKVVIRVAVDRDGKVTSATYEPKGSTTSDSALVEAAIAAAKRARFTESAAFVQGGTITYIFKLKAEK